MDELKLENVVLERCNLGGTGRRYFITIDGKKYIYKPSEDRFFHQPEDFRGIVQEVAYKIQKIVDENSSVFCIYVKNNKLNGSIQEYIDVKEADLLRMHPFDLSQSEINDLLREFIIDYLLCNFDSHANNLIIDKKGVIRGIDKEQAFKYINNEEAKTPNLYFHPNKNYGELPPYYYELFETFIDGGINIDFRVIEKYLKKVNDFPNDEYQKIVLPYVESLPVDNNMKQIILSKIMERKINIELTIYKFFQELLINKKEKSNHR